MQLNTNGMRIGALFAVKNVLSMDLDSGTRDNSAQKHASASYFPGNDRIFSTFCFNRQILWLFLINLKRN